MKRTLIAMLALCMFSTAAPLLAADMDQKDECLLYSQKCKASVDSLQERIKRLDYELKKGTKVYSPAELKKLNEKLVETNKQLDVILEGGS